MKRPEVGVDRGMPGPAQDTTTGRSPARGLSRARLLGREDEDRGDGETDENDKEADEAMTREKSVGSVLILKLTACGSTLQMGTWACKRNSSWSFCCCREWISLSRSLLSASSFSVSWNSSHKDKL